MSVASSGRLARVVTMPATLSTTAWEQRRHCCKYVDLNLYQELSPLLLPSWRWRARGENEVLDGESWSFHWCRVVDQHTPPAATETCKNMLVQLFQSHALVFYVKQIWTLLIKAQLQNHFFCSDWDKMNLSGRDFNNMEWIHVGFYCHGNIFFSLISREVRFC